jgi:Gas vesicle protein G
MGLLKSLVLLPVAPVRGVMWVAERVAEVADRELYDPASIRRQLEELSWAYESGAIDRERYEQAEADLLDRLAVSRHTSEGEQDDG